MTRGEGIAASMGTAYINRGGSIYAPTFNRINTRVPQQPHVEVEAEINIPKLKTVSEAQINSRHNLSSDAIAKAGKSSGVTLAPPETLKTDLNSYNNGLFKKGDNGNVIINGNIYGVKNEGKTLYPISGQGFINLNTGQIKAIQLYKTVPSNILQKALNGAGVSKEDASFAKEFIKKH